MIIEESTFLTVYIFVVMGIFGAVFGSFINCMAWRIAHGESVLKGRSHCAVCGHPLGAADLVPVFSFLFLRGKCRYCRE
ncbi:MAG: prepilin peptidase, partial [Emergencia timonensis]